MTPRWRAAAPALLLATGGCFATRQDVAVLQQDIAVARAESARGDSAQRAQLSQAIATLRSIDQTLRTMSRDFSARQADVVGELRSLGQQLIQVQELTGQSQRRIQELRAEMEQRSQEAAMATRPTAGDTAASPATGPNQLFQLSLDQLRRGSTGTARAGFEELIRQYPTADVAADAQFYIAESYAAEGNNGLADSAYALVVSKYPRSAKAPSALYKRGLALQKAGRRREANDLFQAVIRQYPNSDEAMLARDALRGR